MSKLHIAALKIGAAVRAVAKYRGARHLPLVLVAAAFFGSRAYYWEHYGIRFDDYGIDFACQTLDLELLRQDLLRSVFYLHHQVPLFNVLIGILLQWFPVHHVEAFAVVYVALGLGLAVSILTILRSLGVSPVLRTLATVFFCISPSVVTYEWWASYHQLGAALLGMSLAALCRFLRADGTPKWGHACFALIALAALARAVYGLGWMLAIVAILLWYRPVPRRLVLRVAALPLLLVFLNTVKTPLQTGRSFGHALVAPNLALKMVNALPNTVTDKLFADGTLSPYSRHTPFFIPSTLPSLQIAFRKTGVPALDEERKVNGQSNANYLAHVYFADSYLKDAKWLLVHYPKQYWQSVWGALSTDYVKDAADVPYVTDTKSYRALAPVRERWAKIMFERDGRCWALTFGLPLALLYGILWLLGPQARLSSAQTRTPIIAVATLTILTATATTLVSWGDFNRYRFDVDAYYYALFTLLVCRVLRWLTRPVAAIWHVNQGSDADLHYQRAAACVARTQCRL